MFPSARRVEVLVGGRAGPPHTSGRAPSSYFSLRSIVELVERLRVGIVLDPVSGSPDLGTSETSEPVDPAPGDGPRMGRSRQKTSRLWRRSRCARDRVPGSRNPPLRSALATELARVLCEAAGSMRHMKSPVRKVSTPLLGNPGANQRRPCMGECTPGSQRASTSEPVPARLGRDLRCLATVPQSPPGSCHRGLGRPATLSWSLSRRSRGAHQRNASRMPLRAKCQREMRSGPALVSPLLFSCSTFV
jgi:hypothetical protein